MSKSRNEHLARNNTIMHKIDNIEDAEFGTTDIYKPKKRIEASVDNLFDESFNEHVEKEDDDVKVKDIVKVVGVVVVLVVIAYFGMKMLV